MQREACANIGSRDAGTDPRWIMQNGHRVCEHDNAPRTRDDMIKDEHDDGKKNTKKDLIDA